jgi:predicted secreted protein
MDADRLGHGVSPLTLICLWQLSIPKGYQTQADPGKQRTRSADEPAMTNPRKFILAMTALLLGAFIAYQWYVGATILGLLFDSVCFVFPVCPQE